MSPSTPPQLGFGVEPFPIFASLSQSLLDFCLKSKISEILVSPTLQIRRKVTFFNETFRVVMSILIVLPMTKIFRQAGWGTSIRWTGTGKAFFSHKSLFSKLLFVGFASRTFCL